jgi:hypothetical protein
MEAASMSNLSAALPTWTSRPFELAPARRLAGDVVARGVLTPIERERMYELLAIYFLGTSREQFEIDLAEKDAVILLRDLKDGQIQGFSTLMRIATTIEENKIVAFFSGDTIVAKEFWGETILCR